MDCPICGFNCTKIIHEHGTSYYYSLCKICGFVFQQRRYERSHYETLPYQTQADYDDHTFRRASYIYDFCRTEFKSLTTVPKILDIGCGRGGVMKYLQRQIPFADVSGYTLDMGENEATDLKIMYKNVEDLKQDDKLERHEIIIMSHVVEHFYDLRKAMQNVHNLLAIDGFLYIEVPSFHWCEVRSPSVYVPEHLSYFTKQSLTNLLIKNGFKILKIKESKCWGNIKVIVTLDNTWDVKINLELGSWTMTKHYLAKVLHPYYRLQKNPGANE